MFRARIQRWRARPRSSRVGDLVLAGAIVLVFAAVGANVMPTIRDTKRSKVDLKVAKTYFKSHPELGRYTAPITATEDRLDLACAYPKNSKQGLCMQIDSRTYHTTAIVRTWRCHESPKVLSDPLPGPGAYYCPLNHAKAT